MRKVTLLLAIVALSACQTMGSSSLAMRQIAVLKQNGFKQVDDHWELGLADKLLFGFDDAELRTEQRTRLGELARTLGAIGISAAQIEGHTDSTGNSAYNLALSQRRADAVKHAVVSGGLSEQAVIAKGLGESDPIESNSSVAGRQENRRVVIIVRPADR